MSGRDNHESLRRSAGQGAEAARGNGASGKHTDKITILQSRAGLRLTKRWRAAGKFIDLDAYEDAKYFRIVPQKGVSSIRDLAAVLEKLAQHKDHCVIRGTFAPDRAIATKYEGWYQRLNANFDDAPHHWVMLDVDGLEPKDYHSRLCHPQPFIQDFIEKKLPDCFHYASYYWRLSSSAGAPGREYMLKAHLWFWLATPYTSAQLNLWRMLEALPIDGAVFRTVQIHYTADPVFEGCDDPIPAVWRSGFVDGPFGDEVQLVIPEGLLRAVKTREPGEGAGAPDPTEKPGVIGAFCRAFTIEDVLERWLTEVFDWETAGETRRLDFLEGRGAKGGAFVSDCRQYIGNMHESDPFKGRLANKFDLVRQYVYGHLDDPDDPFDADPTKSASYKATVEALRALPEVQEQLALMAKEEEADQAELEQDLVSQLMALPREGLEDAWVALVKPIKSPVVEHRALEYLKKALATGLVPLKQTLRAARAEDRAEERAKQQEVRLAGREWVRYLPESEAAHAEHVERLIVQKLTGEELRYFTFGGMPSRVVDMQLPYTFGLAGPDSQAPSVPVITPYELVSIQSLCEEVVVFTSTDARAGTESPIRVPHGVQQMLLYKDAHQCPGVVGLVTHPIVMGDGTILNTDGLHRSYALLMHGGTVEFCKPYDQAEAQAAIKRLQRDFLSDFRFASDPADGGLGLDAAAAIGMLFTGVQRRMLPTAPGIAILATGQASGKTTLARRMHVILSQRDMPVASFPEREEEVQKTMLAMLISSPPMICLDNIPDGRTFRSSTIAALLTSSVFRQRLLGASKEIDVPTNTTIVITGNNLQLGRDEDTRWLTIMLDTGMADPEKRSFANPDVMSHARSVRPQVLRDVAGIISGYRRLQKKPYCPQTRFPEWDAMVRQPIMWATGLDIASVFDRNKRQSEGRAENAELLVAIHDVMGDQLFSSQQLIDTVAEFSVDDKVYAARTKLSELIALRTQPRTGSPQKDRARAEELGGLLRRMSRAEVIDEGEVILEVVHNKRRNSNDYRVRIKYDPFS